VRCRIDHSSSTPLPCRAQVGVTLLWYSIFAGRTMARLSVLFVRQTAGGGPKCTLEWDTRAGTAQTCNQPDASRSRHANWGTRALRVQTAYQRTTIVCSARGTSSPMTGAPGISPAISSPPEV
jgi:hypothetical protein